MQPRPQRVANPERSGLAKQHEKDGLESVFRIVLVAQDRHAHAPDQPRVPLDQCRKRQLRPLVPVGGESFQKLPVRQVADGADVVQGLDLPEKPASSQFHATSPFRHLDTASGPVPSVRPRRAIRHFRIMSRRPRMVLDVAAKPPCAARGPIRVALAAASAEPIVGWRRSKSGMEHERGRPCSTQLGAYYRTSSSRSRGGMSTLFSAT